jgi:hypothetical protein
MTKSRRLFWFAVIAFIVLVWLLLSVAGSVNEHHQQTQQAYDQLSTWDAEHHATLTAEAK